MSKDTFEVTREEMDRFDRASAGFSTVFALIEQYIKANEKLGIAGQHMAKTLKGCVETHQADHVYGTTIVFASSYSWTAKTLVQIAETQNTMETLRSSVLEKPLENLATKDIKAQMTADKESLESFKKKMKSAMKKLESKEDKLRAKLMKGRDDKVTAELKEVEQKKTDLLLLFKTYESRQYLKWVQQYITLLDTQAAYHSTTLSMLQSLQPTWTAAQDKKPEEVPADTWTSYVQNPEARQPNAPSAPPVRLAPAGPTSDSKPPTPAATPAIINPTPASAPAAPVAVVIAPAQAATPKQDGKGMPGVAVNAPKPKPASIWKLYPTDDGEDYYYFNEQTGESIWELPDSEVQP